MPPPRSHDLRLLTTPHARATYDGEIALLLRSAPGAHCTVVLSSARRVPTRWSRRPPRIIGFGTQHVTMPPSGETHVTFRLSAEHFAMLHRMQTVRVLARVTAAGADGRSDSTARAFTLHAPRHPAP